MIGTKWYELVLEIGIFGEALFHARVPKLGIKWSCCAKWALFTVFACSCPVVGGEVAQSPRALHPSCHSTDYCYS